MNDVFSGITADEAWIKAMIHVQDKCSGDQCSRLGNMREVLHSSFRIQDPRQRWVFSRKPAINPAFAIAEVFWILNGKSCSRFLNYWNPMLPKFAGTGKQYHGAYGYRIRNRFGFDQLEAAYKALKANPDSRQVVIQIWDPRIDFPATNGSPANQDIPCNICSLLKIRNDRLEWLQIMRSNDLYRGTPYNFVQFTTMQEILAGWLGVQMGEYLQVSDSLHVYESDRKETGITNSTNAYRNADDLSIPKDRSDFILQEMYSFLDTLTRKRLSKKKFHEIANLSSIESGYMNLLLIAAADSARRRGWQEEIDVAKTRCTNSALVYSWEQWEARCAARHRPS